MKTNKIFIGLLVMVVLVAPVLAAPSLPSAFYGDATINGRAVPTGSVITAEINGVQKGSVTATEGKYGGYYASEGKLTVYDGRNGDQILFYIQTPQMTNKLVAAEKGTWLSGSNQEIDLTFTGTEVLKPAGSPGTPAPAGSGGGGGGSSGTTTKTVTNPDDGTTTTVTTTETDEQGVQKTVQDLGNNILSFGTVEVTLIQGDSATFNFYQKHTMTLKVLGSDASIITIDGTNALINFGESTDVDLNKNNENDLKIKLERIASNKATFEMTKLVAVNAPLENSITGLAFGNGLDTNAVIIIIVIIIIILLAYFLLKKNKIKNTKTMSTKSIVKAKKK